MTLIWDRMADFDVVVVFVLQATLLLHFIFMECRGFRCPRGTDFIETGSQCLFALDEMGNFTENALACEKRNAKLFTVMDVRNLQELCIYVQNQLPTTGYAFLNAKLDVNTSNFIWLHDDKIVSFPRKYWMDSIPDGLKCLELFSFNGVCKINDIVCWKLSQPICEFRFPDPCKNGNGGCQEICIPRDVNTWTCKCKEGVKFNKTHCVDLKPFKMCQKGYTHKDGFSPEGDCFKIDTMGFSYSQHLQICDSQKAFPLTTDKSTIQEMCNILREHSGIKGSVVKKFALWLSLLSPTKYNWGNNYRNETVHSRCENKASDGNQFVLYISVEQCCIYQTKFQNAMGICQNKEGTGTIRNEDCSGQCLEKQVCRNTKDKPSQEMCMCTRGYELLDGKCVDKCLVDNGDCHHFCESVYGDVKCSCRPGYVLDTTYNTECKYVDECRNQNGGCQHMCKNDWNGTHWCECRNGYTLVNNTSCQEEPAISGDYAGGMNETTKDEKEKRRSFDIFPVIEYVALILFLFVLLAFTVAWVKRWKKKKESEKRISHILQERRKSLINEQHRQSLSRSRISIVSRFSAAVDTDDEGRTEASTSAE